MFSALPSNTSLSSKVTQCMNVLKVITSHPAFGKPPERPKQTYESSHLYEHNLDINKVVKFPGATRLVVTFDPECRTERQCDYLCFFSRGQQVGLHRYTGDSRQGDNKWPELVVHGDELEFTFYSDGGTNDWGYKFDVHAIFGSHRNFFDLLGLHLKNILMHVI